MPGLGAGFRWSSQVGGQRIGQAARDPAYGQHLGRILPALAPAREWGDRPTAGRWGRQKDERAGRGGAPAQRGPLKRPWQADARGVVRVGKRRGLVLSAPPPAPL